MAAREFISSMVHHHSQDPLFAEYQELLSLHEKKLWHQLTLKLETFIRNNYFKSGPGLKESVELHQHFLRDFGKRINQLRYVKIVIVIAHNLAHNGEGKAAIEFLQKVADAVPVEKEKEANSLLQTEIGFLHLVSLQHVEEAKNLADKVGQVLESFSGADPSVFSSYYRLLSSYFKQQIAATDFYKNTLLYLVYTPLEQIPIEEQRNLAFDLGVTALISPEIHNFGELLAHPILNSLKDTPQHWLVDFLFAFNAGEIDKYNKYLVDFQNQINSQVIIKSNLPLLAEKISLLALMELVFNKPAEERTIPFSVVAQATKLNPEKVELLLMKAMSLKLIKGTIDGVNNTVTVTWVQPRVLDLKQVAKVNETLQRWNGKVKEVLSLVQTETGTELFG